LTALQKCIAALRQLTYDMAANTIDKYLKLSKTIVLECLEYYCLDIIMYFGMSSSHPTIADTQRLLGKTEEHEFSGMLESINCIH
jgi:hypothetical protein